MHSVTSEQALCWVLEEPSGPKGLVGSGHPQWPCQMLASLLTQVPSNRALHPSRQSEKARECLAMICLNAQSGLHRITKEAYHLI